MEGKKTDDECYHHRHKCIICCSSKNFTEGGDKDNKNYTPDSSRAVLNQFCDSFLAIRRLELEEDLSLTLCPNCASFLTSAMELKGKVDEVEEEVRELQINILQKLREVQIHMNKLESKLKSVESLVKESDVDALKPDQEAAEGRMNKGRRATRSKTYQDSPVNPEVIQFRKSIVNAANDLRSFRVNTRKKFFHEECTVAVGSLPSSTSFVKQEIVEDDFPDHVSEIDDTGQCSEASNATDNDIDEEEEENISMPEDNDNIDEFSDVNGDVDEEIEIEKQSQTPISTSGLKRKNKTKSARKTKKKKIHSGSETEDSEEEDEEISQLINSSPSPIPKVDFTSLSKYHGAAIRLLLENDEMTSTKARQLEVKRFSKKKKRISDPNSAEYHLLKFKLEMELLYLDWDPSKNRIQMGGFSFAFNDGRGSFDCCHSNCNQPKFRSNLPDPDDEGEDSEVDLAHQKKLVAQIKRHIINKHLNNFRCQIADCPDKTFYNRKLYELHLQKCHIDSSAFAECDICRRPFNCNGKQLEDHKWTHKNAEEKAADLRFQCSICQEIFQCESVLFRHRKLAHRPRDRNQTEVSVTNAEEQDQIDFDLINSEFEGFPIFPIKKVDFSGEEYTKFKKYALELLLEQYLRDLQQKVRFIKQFKKKTRNVEHSSAEYLLKKFELEKKFHYFDYEPTSGAVHVKGVAVSIDEETHSIGCSNCKFSCKLEWPALTSKTKRNNMKQKLRLRKHLRQSHLYIYQCPVANCEDKSFYNPFFFVYHLKTHIQDNASTHKCDICGKPFFRKSAVKLHKWSHKNAKEKEEDSKNAPKFPCPTCGKSFNSKFILLSHEEVHKQDREKVLCPKCGKSVYKRSFKSHLLTTCVSAPPVKCIYCEKSFKTRMHLHKHVIQIHRDASSKERSFVCEICAKSFKWDNALQTHIKNVHGEKRFSCRKGCGAKFPTGANCRRHENICKK